VFYFVFEKRNKHKHAQNGATKNPFLHFSHPNRESAEEWGERRNGIRWCRISSEINLRRKKMNLNPNMNPILNSIL